MGKKGKYQETNLILGILGVFLHAYEVGIGAIEVHTPTPSIIY